MKIAVCFFGIPRYPKKGKILNKTFYSKIEIDYYAHFWKSEETEEVRSLYNFKNILIEEQKDFSDKFDFDVDLSKTTRGMHNSLSPLYSLNQVGKLIEDEYDYIVLTRTDVVQLGHELKRNLSDNTILYSSFVDGDNWIINENDDHIDFKFICSSKENILYATKLYENLEIYLKDDRIPLCHHRLLSHHLKKKIKKFQMIPSGGEDNGGWYFIRNNNLSVG
jgi:hypothetical protein